MKALLMLPLLTIFANCQSENTQFIRKKIENNDISVKWFYYSYISNTSPDFVVVEKNGSAKEIYKAEWVIADVLLSNSDIILKIVPPSQGIVFTKQVEKEVYGYNIVLDSTATSDALSHRPSGVKAKD